MRLILLFSYVKIEKMGNIAKKGGSRMLGREIDAIYIIAQLIGFAAMGFGMYSYQLRRRMNILILQSLSNLLWVVQYVMLGAYSAVTALALGILRNAVYMLRGRFRFADSKAVPVIFIIIFAISGIFTYEAVFDLLPIAAMIAATLAFFLKNEQLIRCISLVVAVCWLAFGISAGSIASIVSDSLTFIAIVISICKYQRCSSK